MPKRSKAKTDMVANASKLAAMAQICCSPIYHQPISGSLKF
jgi:hypothetical protein